VPSTSSSVSIPKRTGARFFDEALSLWCAKQQLEGVKELYQGGDAPGDEWEDWKAIQRAAYLYRLQRDERP